MSLEAWNLEMQPAIDAEMRRVLDHADLQPYPGMREQIAYHLGWTGNANGSEAQGKRIRPLLVLLCAAAGGADWRCALPAAAAVELLHNFSLVHDDIEDQSPLRRGRPTVWAKWGQAQAINSGDALFTLANSALLRLAETTSNGTALAALQVFQSTCLILTGGQHLDISYENRADLRLSDYWPMIYGKTAALLSACCRLGALTAGVEGARLDAFGRFGSNLGLAFQVQDDWLGIWGSAEQTGKSVQSDLVSGKKTLPVLFALEKGGHFARRWKTGALTASEVSQAALWLEDEGARAYTEREAARLTGEALTALEETQCEGATGAAIQELAERLLKRRS